MKTFTRALAVWASLWCAGASSANEPRIFEEYGVVQVLELESNAVVIDGARYDVALDAKIGVGGSFGALSMLRPGMKVRFSYRDHADEGIAIFWIEQLAPSVQIPAF